MVRFTVDRAAGVRVATFTGVVDERTLLDAYERAVAAPDYDPDLDDLLDFSGAERVAIVAEGVRRLVAYFDRADLPGHHARLAVVAPQDYVFGLARMYETLRGGAPGQIRVFRDRAAAEAWLGLARGGEGG